MSRKQKEKHVVNISYVYDAKSLLAYVKKNPGAQLNKAQVQILFPEFTSNFIKHRTSNRCKKDPMPHGRVGSKPFFIYNQIFAYKQKIFNAPVDLFQDRYEQEYQEEQKSNKGKKGKKGNIVNFGN